MLRLFGPDLRHNLSRRELLQIGGLAMTGLTLESLMERSARAEVKLRLKHLNWLRSQKADGG